MSYDHELANELADARVVEHWHLAALRIISQALGNPYARNKTKTCIDLAQLAADRILANQELREKGQALLDALENCHICGALLHVQREPAHCRDCSANCEDHHQPDCPRFGDLIDALRKVIADTQAGKEPK
jgi:hypothetical protein